jgi:hypothetical protein
VHGIGRGSHLGEVIILDIVESFETGKRDRNSRVKGSFWAIGKTCIWLCTFGTMTTVIDVGFGGIRLVFSQNNLISYTALENLGSVLRQRVVGALTLTIRKLSPGADVL